jgi:hypothetical protein
MMNEIAIGVCVGATAPRVVVVDDMAWEVARGDISEDSRRYYQFIEARGVAARHPRDPELVAHLVGSCVYVYNLRRHRENPTSPGPRAYDLPRDEILN